MNLRDTTPSTYFRLTQNVYAPDGSDGWVFQGPFNEQGTRLADPWRYTAGQRLDVRDLAEPSTFRIAQPAGTPLDFNISGLNIPVVPERVVRIFERMGTTDVQFLPAKIASREEPWFILNVTRVVRCIDDARCSEVVYWKPEDGQPKKVGTYRAIYDMRIDPTKVEGARIFRPWGWLVAIIVSQDIKEALEQEHVTGIKFIEV
ncbi:imm11 family protein [Archangium gephyra]|uniref:imm11 family protein n=1 Tax=Archangium gephyra TaxID=48 RepID=UPI003B7B40F5